jgi:hypothetical protein
VPDWSDNGWDEGDPRHPVINDRFAASGSSDSKWRFTSDPGELIVHGKVIDTVVYRTGSFAVTPAPDIMDFVRRDETGRIVISESLANLHEKYMVMKEWVNAAYWQHSYPTGESIDDALKTTLLGDYPENNNSSQARQFQEWLRSMRATQSELSAKAMPRAMDIGATSLPQIRIRSLLGSLFRPSRAREMVQQMARQVENDVPIELRTTLAMTSEGGGWGFHSTAHSFSANKSFFRTEKGYFGLGPDRFPDSLKNGDKIALIGGLSMPVLLRAVEGRYRLVSHCYVHGMMYGDMWEDPAARMEELTLI